MDVVPIDAVIAIIIAFLLGITTGMVIYKYLSN